MKKIYTLALALALMTAVYGQNKVASSLPEVAPQILTENNFHVDQIDHADNRGDYLWYSDFEDASVWETEVLYGEFGWEITNDETGWFYNNSINSPSDGAYAFVWNDDPTENPAPDPGEYNLTTSDPIDVSDVFRERAETMEAANRHGLFQNSIGILAEFLRKKGKNPIASYQLPLSREIYPLLKFLLEKGAFWSGITRDSTFGGKSSSFYNKVCFYFFA